MTISLDGLTKNSTCVERVILNIIHFEFGQPPKLSDSTAQKFGGGTPA
jgi:hypothetical protein